LNLEISVEHGKEKTVGSLGQAEVGGMV